jgi:TPR repeat protein
VHNSSHALASLLILASIWPAVAQNQTASASLVLACDRVAASPSDANRPAGVEGVETVDPQTAVAACEAAVAVAPDDPRVWFELGRAHAAAKAYDSARQQFSRASDLGYAAARAILGGFYANGLGGLTKDDGEALRLFKLAAEQGDARGNNNLGFFYESARGGLPKNETEAARLYKFAADKGDSLGQYNLGRLYQNGRGGLRQSDREAGRLYKLAADEGHALAQIRLGFFYEQGRGGFPKNDFKAAQYYKRAADQGNAVGQINLGRFYLDGRGGLPQSDGEAARLFQRAAEQGPSPPLSVGKAQAIAQGYLGFLYETGRGGLPQDEVEAARLYHLAAEQGEPFAQNKLATFYEEGRGGLSKNIAEAIRLYKLAAEQDGNPNAKRRAMEALTRLTVSTAAASPPALSGNRPAMPMIGYLSTTVPSASAFELGAFRSALKEAGYVEGQNVAIDFRWTRDGREMNEFAADMVRRRVDIIVASGGSRAAQAAKAATDTVPIVIAGGTDPVQAGWVKSLNRPGGNITGVTFILNQLASKRLGLLLDLVPDASVIGYLVSFYSGAEAEAETKGLLTAARSAGREVIVLKCRSMADVEAAFERLSQRQVAGLVVSAFPLISNNRNKVISLAARYKIPAIYAQSPYAYEGGLMSYMGVIRYRDIVNQYVLPILKGTKPADIPIQMANKFELILNLRTAKALGLEVPATILASADKVIE